MDIEKLYRELARQNGISVDEVKHEIQAAINAAYQNPNHAALTVPRKHNTPTVEELMQFIKDKLQGS